MNGRQLKALLEEATADLPVRDRTTPAVERARSIVRTRRALGAAGVAAVVATVLSAPLVVDGSVVGPPLDHAPSTGVPAPGGSAVPERGRTIDPLAVPAWDPFSVADAPWGDSVLPEVLAPPDGSPSVLDEPLAAAVVAWPEEGRDVQLLGTDRTWRSIPDTAHSVAGLLSEVVTPELTSDGRLVAMSTTDGVLVVDVAHGTQRLLPWPDRIAPPWDTAPRLEWLPGDRELLVQHWKRGWIVGLDGRDRPAPYPGAYGDGVFVDPDGPVRQWRWDDQELVEWAGDRIVRTVHGSWWGERYTAGYGLVGFTGSLSGDSRNGPAVVRAEDGTTVAYLPIRDPHAAYSDNGHLTAQAFLDEHTLLLLIAPVEPGDLDRSERWYLVTWDFVTGELHRLATGDSRMRTIDVAPGALG